MNKKTNLLIILLAAFLVLGFSCQWNQPEEDDDSSPIEDFQNAIESGQKMKCTYKSTGQGSDMESTSYVQGEKYRSEYEFNGEKNISVFDGSVVYTWNETTRQGTKMELSCMEDLSAGQEEAADDTDYEDYQSSEELLDAGMDVKCSKVSSIDFSVPTDIEFIDQCEQLRQSMEAIKGLQDQLPNLEGLNY